MKKGISLFIAVSMMFMLLACSSQETIAESAAMLSANAASALSLAKESKFTDVPEDAYYAEAVKYNSENGFMNGTSATTFSPNGMTTRAQIVTILWRQAGSPTVGSDRFIDVPSTAYYSDAVTWAEEKGIVAGYNDGRFGPGDPITLIQLVTILWRTNGSQTVPNQGTLDNQDSILAYAVDAVAWAKEKGIISDEESNDLNRNATRAQTATILYRYLTGGGQSSGGKTLVVYFSATGTTKTIAEYAADILDADIYEITPETDYTQDDLNYNNSSSRANREQNDSTARPLISNSVAGMDNYDTVLIGYPIWHGQAPRIISTFLESYDFSGKTIVPFCTSHSSGVGSSDTNLHNLTSDKATWLSGERFSSGTLYETIKEWLDSMSMTTTTSQTVGDFNFETKTVLLNSGYEMPIVGLGTYSLLGKEGVDSVTESLQAGGRLIDTASIYSNEESVGQGVRESGVPREEVFITTKLYPNQFSNAAQAIDEALEKLNVDYIDLMLLHHPGTNDVEAYKAMEQAVEEGEIRSIGLSNWYVKELNDFLPQITITPAIVQNEIHPYYQENDVIPFIQEKGIVVEGWYPFGGRGHTAELLGDETISTIAQAHDVSTAQVILRWNLQKGVVVIPGSSNPDHIKENLDIFGFELSDDEMAKINALDRGEKHDWY